MVVEYANHLSSIGHDVTIEANIVNTIFKVQSKINHPAGLKSKMHTVMNAVLKKTYDYYDIIVADIIMMVFFLSFRNRKRLLYFAQDYDEAYYKNHFMKLLVRTVYFYCLRILRIPVIAVSEELDGLLRRRFDAHVTVVPNGVDTGSFFPDRDKKYHLLKGHSKAVLIFARSDYRKGFDIAVKVLSGFATAIERGEISVWAVGERIDVPFLMRNFGFVPPEQLRKILSCSDVLLYPSRHEGLPLLVLEALSCGCPVVTTEAVHFLKNKDNALVCKIKDVECLKNALEKVVTDADLRSRLKQAGFEVARAYSLSESKIQFHKALSQAGAKPYQP